MARDGVIICRAQTALRRVTQLARCELEAVLETVYHDAAEDCNLDARAMVVELLLLVLVLVLVQLLLLPVLTVLLLLLLRMLGWLLFLRLLSTLSSSSRPALTCPESSVMPHHWQMQRRVCLTSPTRLTAGLSRPAPLTR